MLRIIRKLIYNYRRWQLIKASTPAIISIGDDYQSAADHVCNYADAVLLRMAQPSDVSELNNLIKEREL